MRERSEVFAELRGFIARELLYGQDAGLDGKTPLLEIGLINSTSVTLLLTFIERRFALEIPVESIRPVDLVDIEAITEMVLRAGPG